jgi:hypothetical protein
MKPRPVLTYDDAAHAYYLDGQRIPGVTGIIRQQLSPLHNGQSDLMQRAANFGKAVHLATELWDKGTLDMATLDPELVPYLEGWRQFRTEHPGEILANEQPICSYKYRFGGTMDRIICAPVGPCLYDIKTGTTLDAGTGPQTAGYSLAAWEYLGIKIKNRWCIQLTADGYKLHQLKDPADLPAFLSALNCFNWRNAHGK